MNAVETEPGGIVLTPMIGAFSLACSEVPDSDGVLPPADKFWLLPTILALLVALGVTKLVALWLAAALFSVVVLVGNMAAFEGG